MDDLREIGLAGRSASRVVWAGRLVVRFWQIAFWLTVTIAALPIFWISQGSSSGGLGSVVRVRF